MYEFETKFVFTPESPSQIPIKSAKNDEMINPVMSRLILLNLNDLG